MTYEEGRQARRDGKPESANPYPETSPQHALWSQGWRDSDTILKALEAFQ